MTDMASLRTRADFIEAAEVEEKDAELHRKWGRATAAKRCEESARSLRKAAEGAPEGAASPGGPTVAVISSEDVTRLVESVHKFGELVEAEAAARRSLERRVEALEEIALPRVVDEPESAPAVSDPAVRDEAGDGGGDADTPPQHLSSEQFDNTGSDDVAVEQPAAVELPDDGPVDRSSVAGVDPDPEDDA